MIVTLSGVTGCGKSYFKNLIAKNMCFENLIIYTTRPKRENEICGKDKIFVTDYEFMKLVNNGIISYYFNFLGYKYGYKKENLQSSKNQVTEVHYSTIYDFKKNAKDVFAIYIVPNDYDRAKKELIKRGLPKKVEEERLKEIDEHIYNFSKDTDIQKQFDCIFINNYDEESDNRLLELINNKLNEEVKRYEKKSNCRKLENEYAS